MKKIAHDQKLTYLYYNLYFSYQGISDKLKRQLNEELIRAICIRVEMHSLSESMWELFYLGAF